MGVMVASLIGNESARLTGADVGTDEMQTGRTTEVQPRMTPGWLHRGGDEHLLCTVDDNNNNNNSTVNAHLDVPHCCSAMTNIAIKIRTASPAIESHTNTYCRGVYLALDTCTSLCTLAVAVQAVVEFRQPCGNRGSLNAASSPK